MCSSCAEKQWRKTLWVGVGVVNEPLVQQFNQPVLLQALKFQRTRENLIAYCDVYLKEYTEGLREELETSNTSSMFEKAIAAQLSKKTDASEA